MVRDLGIGMLQLVDIFYTLLLGGLLYFARCLIFRNYFSWHRCCFRIIEVRCYEKNNVPLSAKDSILGDYQSRLRKNLVGAADKPVLSEGVEFRSLFVPDIGVGGIGHSLPVLLV